MTLADLFAAFAGLGLTGLVCFAVISACVWVLWALREGGG